jgi:hypothetical protein
LIVFPEKRCKGTDNGQLVQYLKTMILHTATKQIIHIQHTKKRGCIACDSKLNNLNIPLQSLAIQNIFHNFAISKGQDYDGKDL